MTRVYRTGAIAANENINFGDAWGAGRDGENVFIQDRINTAISRYGNAIYINVAKRIAAGVAPEIIFAEA